jgi:6-phosphogluconolactonase
VGEREVTGRRVRVAADAAALAGLAAEEIVRRAAEAVRARGRFLWSLAGGGTPRAAYARLAAARDAVPWDKVHVFFGDERCVPPDHPDSNYRMAHQALLSRVPLAAANVHRIRGEDDPAAAAAACEAELRAAAGAGPGAVPRLDLALLGMGPDGHVASLFPGSAALRERARLAVAVPRPSGRGVTLTLPVLNAARAVLLLVAGAEKAERVREVLAGEGDPELPARLVRPSGELLWLLDEAAAARLPAEMRGGSRAG